MTATGAAVVAEAAGAASVVAAAGASAAFASSSGVTIFGFGAELSANRRVSGGFVALHRNEKNDGCQRSLNKIKALGWHGKTQN